MTDKSRDAAQQDIRCQCCGYMTYHREHLGCIRAALAEQTAQSPTPDWISYNKHSDVLTIRGRRYDAALFDERGFGSPPGTLLRIVDGPADVVTLERVAEQQDAQAVPLTEKQRVYLAQAWAMLEDYAADQRQAGNDSIADGADASAHEIKLMLNTAPTPPAQGVMLTANELLNMTPESIPAEHDGALLEYARAVIEAYERKNGIK